MAVRTPQTPGLLLTVLAATLAAATPAHLPPSRSSAPAALDRVALGGLLNRLAARAHCSEGPCGKVGAPPPPDRSPPAARPGPLLPGTNSRRRAEAKSGATALPGSKPSLLPGAGREGSPSSGDPGPPLPSAPGSDSREKPPGGGTAAWAP